MKKRLDLQEKAELAMRKAVKKVIERRKKTGQPMSIWKDGKVIQIYP